ncbi:MAG: hypothetical protein LBB81_04390 [Treponema sp.]|jgi:hypothetical protein|nr:hypothetical protein [Treponema sp.]
MMLEQALNSRKPDIRLELIRRRINDEGYLHAAIQRLALVLSNEIMEINHEGGCYERQRKRRK